MCTLLCAALLHWCMLSLQGALAFYPIALEHVLVYFEMLPTSKVWLRPLHQPCIQSVLLRAKEDLLPVDGCHLRTA